MDVVQLGRPQPARQLGAYLIGGLRFSIIFGLLIVLALHGSNLRLGKPTVGCGQRPIYTAQANHVYRFRCG